MSESPVLPSLFAQLQARYPTSGLLTELVQMDADRCVVRALVQLGSMTLATSMATAATVEQAEDQARLRVLALLGIRAALMPGVATVALAPPLTAMTELPQNVERWSMAPSSVKPLESLRFQDAIATEESVPEAAAIAPSPIVPGLAFQPGASIATPVPVTESDTTDSTVPERIAETGLDMFDAPPIRDDVSFNKATYDEELFEAEEPLAEAVSDDRPSPGATTAEAPATKGKPRKPGAGKPSALENEPTEAASASPSSTSSLSASPSSASPSRDLSSLISQIGVEIDRIGWSKRQGSTYLQKTYGKKTRSELTDDELEDFLTYLNTQPSATVSPLEEKTLQ